MNGPGLAAPVAGLGIAWGGTALLVSPVGRLLGDPERIATKCLGQLALWTLFAGVLGVVILWEQQPLSSLWLQSLRWESVAWGLAFTAFTLWLVIPAREWVRRAARLSGYRAGAEKVIDLPLWFRVLAVITAGVVEETLF